MKRNRQNSKPLPDTVVPHHALHCIAHCTLIAPNFLVFLLFLLHPITRSRFVYIMDAQRGLRPLCPSLVDIHTNIVVLLQVDDSKRLEGGRLVMYLCSSASLIQSSSDAKQRTLLRAAASPELTRSNYRCDRCPLYGTR